jgi:hypothetical protein
MAVTSERESSRSQGGHSGQWGLASILLAALVLLLFPMMVLAIFAAMTGAYHDAFLESRDIDLAIWATWAMVGGMAALAVFALLCGLMGLGAAVRRGQPAGLSLAGTVVALAAVAVCIPLILATLRGAEWARELQKERFGPGVHRPPPVWVP